MHGVRGRSVSWKQNGGLPPYWTAKQGSRTHTWASLKHGPCWEPREGQVGSVFFGASTPILAVLKAEPEGTPPFWGLRLRSEDKVFAPTAGSQPREAPGWSGAVRFHEGFTRVPPRFHEGSTRVPRVPRGFHDGSTRFCKGCGVVRALKRAPHAVGDGASFFFFRGHSKSHSLPIEPL